VKRKTTILVLLSVLIFPFSILNAQTPYVRQVFTANSGKFEFVPPYTDFVTVQSNHPVTGATSTVQTLGTQSAQDLLKNGNLIYLAAQDSLIAFNADTYERVAAIADSGLNKLLLKGDKLVVTKQYPITNHFVEVRNASDLSLVTSVGGIPGDCGGMAILGDSLYVAVNGGWMGTEGKIAVIETTGWTLSRIINLGTEAVGIMSMYTYGGKIFTVNKSPFATPDQGSISVYDPANGTFSNTIINKNVATGTGIDGSLLYFIMGYGIASFNLNTLQIEDSVVVADPGSSLFMYITSSVLDTLNNRIYANVGDYFSPGYCLVSDYSGDSLTSWATGISSDAVLVDYRVTPAGLVDNINNPFRIWPNPATKVITIDLGSDKEVECIRVFDRLGRTVLTIPCKAGEKSWSTDVSGLRTGLYLIVAYGKHGEQFSSRFIRQ
jgi:hypothetical protein